MADDLKFLINKRGQIKAKITRFQSFFDNPNNQHNVAELKVRLDKLEECWGEFESIQEKIEILVDDVDHCNERESFESQYFSLLSRVQQHILDNSQKTSSVSVSHTSSSDSCQSNNISVKLPTINLPTFSGKYEHWVSFFDTFNALIDKNESLSEVQKLHYLKASLVNDAAKVLANLELISTNYKIAIDLLKDEYENTRLIVQNHIKSLFELPQVHKDSPAILKQLINTVQTNLRALESQGQHTEHWDQMIIHLITTKLDINTHREWELTTTKNELPTLKKLLDFLQKRSEVIENVQKAHGRQTLAHNEKTAHTHNKNQTNYTFKAKSHFSASRQDQQCGFCHGKHLIFHCENLKSAPKNERVAKLIKNNICINCLTQGHNIEECHSRGCKTCGRKHNSMLHIFSKPSGNTQTTTKNSSAPTESFSTSQQSHNYTVASSSVQNVSDVLLSTAVVDLISSNGNKLTCRAFLDNGSQSSFLTESVCQRLGLKKNKTSVLITGIGQNSTHITNKVNATLQSKTTDYSIDINFFVLPKITSFLPSKRINTNSWNIPNHLTLADPHFYEPSKIDILLGQEHFFEILAEGKIKNKGMPILQNTTLGWVLGGRINDSQHNYTTTCHVSVLERLDHQLQEFWKIEEPAIKTPLLSQQEQNCEEQYIKSVQRADDGRYIVKMPVKTDFEELGNSKQTAIKRLQQVERRLAKENRLKNNYNAFMKEYEELGHMEPVNNSTNSTPEYYLPHHPVLKESSSTTKLRVVFDASAKTSSGISLNDTLLVGPTVQDDLISILLRFRMHVYVMSADIEKMYRQILIHPSQRDLLKIVWRRKEGAEIQTFQLKTVTYGTACAPYLATRTLNQLAIDEQKSFCKAAKVVLSDIYVDDLLSGAESLSECLELQSDIINLLKRGGFNLRKWNANHDGLLQHLPPDMRERQPQAFTVENPTKRALGIVWDATEDIFKFTHNNIHQETITKRTILSQIASLFDPLGLLSPIVIKAKIFLQTLWKAEISWDDSLPIDLENEWRSFQTYLTDINSIHVPRSVKTDSGGTLEIHGFADASERAYGAAVYIRHVSDDNNTITSRLLCSKSRVAPVKSVSLPRLELCGALLLATLIDHVKKAIKHDITKIVYWTDSTIVISWLNSHASRWKTFVANRVAKIQDMTQADDWRHVRSQENPADLVSRGTTVTELKTSELWWSGPQWLVRDETQWPIFHHKLDQDLSQEEKKTVKVAALVVKEEYVITHLINKHSTLQRLQRTTAYCLRFINNCRNINKKLTGPLTPEELSSSLQLLIRHEQKTHLKEDYQNLRTCQQVKTKSKLATLQPFLNADDLICVGGRLQNSQVDYTQKHPTILPSESHLTRLIIRNEHIRQLHAGPQSLLAALRRQYWPLNARNITRKIVHQCVTCFKAKPKWSQPTMGNLPTLRTTPSRPFTNTGVDYCGPVYIKSGLTKNNKIVKGYIAIFVCFATKAVHLELVTDMTTETFLAAYKRFIARRGICKNVYSDNGSNFVGANNEMQELRQLFQDQYHQKKIIDSNAMHQTKWHFIPPRAPHFGGLWEAGVKSVKHHLRRIVANANLTFEQYYTTLTSIEACLNSRPLTPLSLDPTDPLPLTPGHFLTGDALTALPEPDLTSTATSRLSHWQRVQQLTQHFWKRWSSEYLNQLQQRPKWVSGSADIQPGQVVLVREDNLPPLKWVSAIVKELHPGSDGKVRVATVQTTTGQMKRPVNRLCVLPTNV